MVAKMLEVRDAGTFIPVLAVKMGSDDDQERWLTAKAGFGQTSEDHGRYVVLCQVLGGEGRCTCDPYDWGQNPRTYFVAHQYIVDNFDLLKPGAVVDVEYILAEQPEPKKSDRYYVPEREVSA